MKKILFITIVFIILSSCSNRQKENSINATENIKTKKILSTTEYKNKIIELFDEIPSLKKYAPATYNYLIFAVEEAYENGKSKAEITSLARSIIYILIESRLAHANDDIILDYMEIVVLELNEFKKIGGNECYQALMPSQEGYINRKLLPKSLANRELVAFGAALKTSVVKKEIPSQDLMLEKAESVFNFMDIKYGDDFDLMGEPQFTDQNKQLVCDVTIDFYSKILELPKKDALIIIRWMWGSP